MMVLPDPSLSVQLMIENGIFDAFLPEVTEDAGVRFGALLKREGQLALAPTLESRLLSLLPNDGDKIDKLSRRLKFSNALRKGLAARLSQDEVNADNIRGIAYRADIPAARDMAMLYAADADACLARLNGWEVPNLPISGKDLIAMGIEAGPQVSRLLEAVRAQWIAEDFPDGQRVQDIAREFTSE